MRRRQVWANQGNVPSVPAPVVVTGKGICKHCKKYVGRGIYFHEKNCK